MTEPGASNGVPAGQPRHLRLRRALAKLYAVPGFESAVRRSAQLALQRVRLPRHSIQRRIFNLVAEDATRHAPVPIRSAVHINRRQRLLVDVDLREPMGRAFFYYGYTGGYEPGTTLLLRALAPTAKNIFDIGANIGYYSLLAAALAPPSAQVHCFEPVPSVYEQLRRNVELNRLSNVRLIKAAAADTEGSVNLAIPLNRDGHRGFDNASMTWSFSDHDEVITARAARLDRYCLAIGADMLGLVKIDVEGAEARVLRGMGELLFQQHPDIILEVLPGCEDDVESALAGTRYNRFRILPDRLEEVKDFIGDAGHNRNYFLTVQPPPVLER